MPIAGVVILTLHDKADEVLLELQNRDGITTYGVHKENNIIAVFETESVKSLKDISSRLISEIPEILGIYPSSIYYDEEQVFDQKEFLL